jgi:predicted outer membrane repeat protein
MRMIQAWGRAVVLLATAAFAVGGHAADGVVGPGNCNEAGFVSVLASVQGSGGGTITFDCGTATITFTSYKEISSNVQIDGAGRITFDGGNASAFFQVFASASLTLLGVTLQHGVFNASHAIENFGTLSLQRVSMVSNSSTDSALVNYGDATVSQSTFANNAASAGAHGGAIANVGTSLGVDSSTFNGNSATLGAAIYSEADLTVVNSTFSANNASSGGGGIYQAVAGTAFVDFVTAVGNSGTFGAGIYNDGGGSSTMLVGASLLSGNATGNCDGVILSSGYNLSDDTHCGAAFTGPGDVNGVTLAMQPLGNYGGPTQTQPPQAGNPAIDHVPLGSCTVAFDQRGGARPFGAACDSGAVEVGAAADDRIFFNGFDPG